jgi:ketosteroid isomerase-like protein
MGERENRETAERYMRAIEQGDFDAVDELLHDDYVQEWPQSGERIRGKRNARAINENYPGLPTASPRRALFSGDLGVTEMTLDYDGKIYHSASIVEFRDGKIFRETDYFAEPFEAPEWRAKWVEKMSSAAETAAAREETADEAEVRRA